jgi:hypothetical protein
LGITEDPHCLHLPQQGEAATHEELQHQEAVKTTTQGPMVINTNQSPDSYQVRTSLSCTFLLHKMRNTSALKCHVAVR